MPRANGKPSAPAVYLSGNGPLVQVLQDALKDAGGGGRTFVQAIKNYVAQHSRPRSLRDQVLVVAVDEPAWATQLRWLEADLLARLEAVLGAGQVSRIEVRVLPV